MIKKNIKKNINNTLNGINNTKIASDYDDPDWVEINVLMPEILQAYKEQYEDMKKEGYKSPFIDFLKDEIRLKRKKFAEGSSFMNDYRLQSQYLQQPSNTQIVPEARGIARLSYLI